MGIHLTEEVLRLPLRDPFRIARADHDSGHAITTVVPCAAITGKNEPLAGSESVIGGDHSAAAASTS